MAGIFGVWDPSKPRGEESFRTLLDRAQSGFDLPLTEFNSSDLRCGTALKPVQHPSHFVSSSGDRILLIQGEILDLSNDHKTLERFIEQLALDPIAALDEVDGAYAGALIELTRSEITLFADQFANFALHYHWSKERMIFSTQSSAIASVLRAPVDDESLLEYLAVSQNLGSRTIYRSIRRVRPGEIVKMSPQGCRSSFFARPDYYERETEASVGELARTLSTGITRRIEGKRTAAGLSGGMDTRLIWSGILGSASHVTAHSHGSPGSRDLLIGAEISRKLNIKSTDLVFDDEFVERSIAGAEDLVRLSEGGLRLHECFIGDIWRLLSRDHDLLLDGHGGALYSRQIMKSIGLKIKSLEELEAAWRPRLLSALMTSDLIRQDVKEYAQSNLKESLLSEFRKYEGIGNIQDIIDIFYIRDLGWRPSLSGNAQLNYLGLHHPLMTRDLARLAERVPVSKKLRHWVHRNVIRKLAPELARFAVDNDGLPATFAALPLTRIPAILFERSLRKLAPPAVRKRLSLLRPTNTAMQFLQPQSSRIVQRMQDLPIELVRLLRDGAQDELLTRLAEGHEEALLTSSQLVSASIMIGQGR